MTILVTGGAGFIGSNFILNWLKKYDEKIINLDNLTYSGNLENLKSIEKNLNYQFFKGNICDSDLVENILNWLLSNGYNVLSRTRGNVLIASES